MSFPGSMRHARVSGQDAVEQVTNYLTGNQPSGHVTNVPNYARVKYRSLYPGIDAVFYGHAQDLEFDFLVAPGADPHSVTLRFSGKRRLQISSEGALVVPTSGGDLTFRKPVAYQTIDGRHTQVEVAYKILKDGDVRFALGDYDRKHQLVIDPILSYSTYLGGQRDDQANGIAVDLAGNAYITGYTASTDFPAPGGYKTRLTGNQDAFVAKMNATGTGLVYATYLGARNADTKGNAIAVDGSGKVTIVGTTGSDAFPVTTGAYQTTGAGALRSFVTRLNDIGNALVFSTYLNNAEAKALALDGAGNTYVVGTAAGAFATTPGAFQANNRNVAAYPYYTAFAAKLNPSGTAMSYATFLGGSGNDRARAVAVDAQGHAYVAGYTTSSDFPIANAIGPYNSGGQDAFVAELDGSGASLVMSTYLGGSRDDSANGVALDSQGNIVVVGMTRSANFPVVNAFQPRTGQVYWDSANAFVTKLNPATSSYVYSSYLGGQGCVPSCYPHWNSEVATSVAVDRAGFAYVTGISQSIDFPALDPIQKVASNGTADTTFLAKIRPTGEKAFATILGQPYDTAQDEILTPGVAIDSTGNAYVASWVDASIVFPTTAGAFQPVTPNPGSTIYRDAVVFKVAASERTISLQVPGDDAYVPAPVSPSTPVTLTAFIERGEMNGTVTFVRDAYVLGTVPATDGKAELTVTLTAGVHQLTAINDADGTQSLPVFKAISQPTF